MYVNVMYLRLNGLDVRVKKPAIQDILVIVTTHVMDMLVDVMILVMDHMFPHQNQVNVLVIMDVIVIVLVRVILLVIPDIHVVVLFHVILILALVNFHIIRVISVMGQIMYVVLVINKFGGWN
jgi:hypothetical protein